MIVPPTLRPVAPLLRVAFPRPAQSQYGSVRGASLSDGVLCFVHGEPVDGLVAKVVCDAYSIEKESVNVYKRVRVRACTRVSRTFN
jgi:hypothetical protein